jgi:hypothetical protein
MLQSAPLTRFRAVHWQDLPAELAAANAELERLRVRFTFPDLVRIIGTRIGGSV